MLKVEKIEIMNVEGAIRGMRNPMNSWDSSDSYLCFGDPKLDGCYKCKEKDKCIKGYKVGPVDFALAEKLCRAGSDHRKFMRQILIGMDITAPLYWWKEFDTYKVGTVANSCSTMHKLTSKPIVVDDFSFDNGVSGAYSEDINNIVKICENLRQAYNINKDKEIWRMLIQMLPESYNQKRTVTLNYEVLTNIYKSRRGHKLDEWHTFCEMIEDLPLSDLIISASH